MTKMISTALAIAIVTGGGASHAGVILTEENMDLITAGLTFGSYSMSANTENLSSATPIVIGDTTLVGTCSGNSCTVTVRTSAGANTCTSCTLTVNQSGITVADTSGHVWYAWTGVPQNSQVITSLKTILAP
jgi:predicted hotdog family 3-hydroxylacyl-ACP dehydratase